MRYKKIINLVLLFYLIFCFLCCCSCSKLETERENTWYHTQLQIEELHSLSTGQGQTIAIIDTGINEEYLSQHTNNIISTYNVLEDNENVLDEHGHGTEMASILLGDAEQNIVGIAPDCKLHVIKAIGSSGSVDNSILAKAIEYAVSLNPSIINLSLASYNNELLVEKAVKHAIDSNIVVIAAVGDYYAKDILYPAAYPNVISVQGIDKKGQVLSTSNVSDKTVLSMPGQDIKAVSFSDDNTKKTNSPSGSSEATVIASGYISLLKSYAEQNNQRITNLKLLDFLIKQRKKDKTLQYVDLFHLVEEEIA